MSILENKIDFVVLISVNNANPNGDPLNGNRPRTTYTGLGEISDVCIKRKIRIDFRISVKKFLYSLMIEKMMNTKA